MQIIFRQRTTFPGGSLITLLRQMECTLALSDGNRQSLAKGVQAAVVGKLQVVDTGHDTRQVVVGGVWRFAGPTDHSEDRSETLEA